MHLDILIQICELLAVIPYLTLEYTTAKYTGKAFAARPGKDYDLQEIAP